MKLMHCGKRLVRSASHGKVNGSLTTMGKITRCSKLFDDLAAPLFFDLTAWGTKMPSSRSLPAEMIFCTVLSLFGVALTLSFSAATSEFGTKEEAVAMVRNVQEKFKTSGPEATFKAVNDKSTPEFHDRDLYPFIYDLKGLNVAHGARPALVGKNLISLKDQDGKYLIQEMIEIANGPGNGWVDYKWPNPITNKIEDKTSYIERMGEFFVGVGVYRPGPPL